MWGVTGLPELRGCESEISIHTPRVGRDGREDRASGGRRISIHTPRVGRDFNKFPDQLPGCVFQSTRPVWGVTTQMYETRKQMLISIHTPRVGRDYRGVNQGSSVCISIHTPRVGRDIRHLRIEEAHVEISIHTPRVGRDASVMMLTMTRWNFNPHAPCGA